MRALLVLAPLLLAGCAGPGEGTQERGGWSVFSETCSECAQLIFSTRSGEFEIAETFPLVSGARLFAYYESPVEAGTRIVLRWTSPILPDIETRRATSDTTSVADEQTCIAAEPAPQPTPTSPTPPGAPLGAGRECTLDMVTQTRLEAPRNGITIRWVIPHASGAGNATFSAQMP